MDSAAAAEDAPPPRDWESIVLDRLRPRIGGEAGAMADVDEDCGWEAAALERLRAFFDAER